MAKETKYDMESGSIDYETYKPKGSPGAKATSRQIEKGSISAYNRAEKAFREANDERRREKNRGMKNELAASGKTRLTTDDKRL